MKTRKRFSIYLFMTLFLCLAFGGWAEAQQTKFWAMDVGNSWYYSGIGNSWDEITTIDWTSFPVPTYLMNSYELENNNWVFYGNWWYSISEISPTASELKLWKIREYDDVDRTWISFTFDSGITWARRPMVVGDSWGSSTNAFYDDSTPVAVTVNSTVVAYEPVTVPYGSFYAYQIQHSISIPPFGQLTRTTWMIPYFGSVAVQNTDLEGTETDSLTFLDIATVFYDTPFDWAYPYIMKIYDAGITAGYGDGRYGPEDPVTREQMAVFILKVLKDIPNDGSCGGNPPFPDVPADRWSCKYIKRLAELGITSGYGDGTYGPTDAVTREQMAVFITRALGQVPPEGYCGTTSPFIDVPYDFWSCKYVKMLADLGITAGYGDGRYGPWYEITRAEMAVFLSRAMALLD